MQEVQYNRYSSNSASKIEQIAVQLRKQNYDVVDFDENKNLIRCSDFLFIIQDSYQFYQLAIRSENKEPPALLTTLSMVEIEGIPYFITVPFPMNLKNIDSHLNLIHNQISTISKQRQTIPVGFTAMNNSGVVVKSNLTDIVDEILSLKVIANLKHKLFIIRGKIGVGKKTMIVKNLKGHNIIPVCFQDESLPVQILVGVLGNLKTREGMGLVINEVIGNQILDSISSTYFNDLIRALQLLSQKLPVVIITDQPLLNTSFRSSPLSAITIDLFKEEIEEIYCMQIIQRVVDKSHIKYYSSVGQIANPLFSIIKNS